MNDTKNARITSTMLGREDHGILTCMLYLDYGGSAQGFGGYAFDTWNKKTEQREGVAFGIEFIKRLLDVVGVDKWEKLPGSFVRVRSTHSKVEAIGNLLDDKWFSPEELAKELGLR